MSDMNKNKNWQVAEKRITILGRRSPLGEEELF